MPTPKKKKPSTKKAVLKKNARQEIQPKLFELISDMDHHDFLTLLEHINCNVATLAPLESWCESIDTLIEEEDQAFNNKRLKEIEAKVKKSGLTTDDIFFYFNR